MGDTYDTYHTHLPRKQICLKLVCSLLDCTGRVPIVADVDSRYGTDERGQR
jgi:hypothetical protein